MASEIFRGEKKVKILEFAQIWGSSLTDVDQLLMKALESWAKLWKMKADARVHLFFLCLLSSGFVYLFSKFFAVRSAFDGPEIDRKDRNRKSFEDDDLALQFNDRFFFFFVWINLLKLSNVFITILSLKKNGRPLFFENFLSFWQAFESRMFIKYDFFFLGLRNYREIKFCFLCFMFYSLRYFLWLFRK